MSTRGAGGRRSVRATVREAWDEFVADTRDRIRTRGEAAVFRALRLSGAATASYVVAHSLSPETVPILAPLTALLVVQVTLTSTLHSGVERVVSVVAGVLLAIIFSGVVGLVWWSLALLIAVSIVVGQLLRLGPNLIEVPISAMLVLAVASAEQGDVGFDRIYETLIGAGVGVVVNVLFPPAVRRYDAGERVAQFAERIASILDVAADDLSAGPVGNRARNWLEEARRLTRHVPSIYDEISSFEESRHLNVRALGTPNTAHGLRIGFEALEHSLIAVRSLFRSIVDGVRAGSVAGDDEESPRQPQEEDDYAEDVREVFAVLLRDLAACFRSYGRMLQVEVEHESWYQTGQVGQALTDLREARARTAEMLLMGAREDPEYWELNVALLATVERVLRELDVDDYAHRRKAALEAERGPLVRSTHEAARRWRRFGRPLGS
ncbi:aromatic acid exporter family protein [Spongisporangium articulatum]|uniref:Aromatic acid exporter family protein n=1 Tax=Spongisporangium articulatum TaxID=3362603 RepID=A0ABW8ATZ9_9ACTN